MLLKELLSLLLFAAVVFGVYKGAGYLRGIQLNRVYGKTATVLEKQMMERKDWKYAASTEEDDPTAKPDDVEPYLVILVGRFSTKDPHFWDVLAWSGKDKTSLEGVNTVIFCQYTTKTASYGPAGSKTSTTSGTSEYVTTGMLMQIRVRVTDWKRSERICRAVCQMYRTTRSHTTSCCRILKRLWKKQRAKLVPSIQHPCS